MFNIRVYGILIGENKQVLVSDELIRGGYYTKFPEFKEEMDLDVRVGDHIYTTDYFQMSAFNPQHQIISIYYFAHALEPIKAPLRLKPFDFDEQQLAMYKEKGETETFRFIDWNDFSEESVSLPIDKIVARMLKTM